MLSEKQIQKFNKIFHEQLEPILLENEDKVSHMFPHEQNFKRLLELLEKNHCSQMDKREYFELIDKIDDVREDCYRILGELNNN
jgi:hypothetical protein